MVKIIIINDIYGRIEGGFDDTGLDLKLSFCKSNFWWKSAAARFGGWDGRTHLYSRANGMFPLGLLRSVKNWFEQEKIEYVIQDLRPDVTINRRPVISKLGGDITLRDDQRVAILQAVNKCRGIIHGATGCLAGDTLVELHRAGKSFNLPIEDLVWRFNGGATRQSWEHIKNRAKKAGCATHWDRRIKTKIRYRDSEGYIRLTEIVDAYFSGRKQTFILITDDGHTIRATADHRFLTPGGWKRLDQLSQGAQILVLDSAAVGHKKQKKKPYRVIGTLRYHPFAGRRNIKRGGYSVPLHRLVVEADLNDLSLNEFLYRVKNNNQIEQLVFIDPKIWHVHHKDGNTLNNVLANLEVLTATEHRRKHGVAAWKKFTQRTRATTICSIIPHMVEATYDIAVQAKEHNFVANSIIVHNCGKTEVAAGIIATLNTPPTLFFTGRKKLARQTRERFALRLGVGLDDIGLIQGGHWLHGSTGVYVAVVDTLMQDKFKHERDTLFAQTKLLFIDEAHHSGSNTWYNAIMKCKASYRFGLTGTPVGRSDFGDLYLRACTGDVIARISAVELINQGILARPTIYFVPVTKPKIVALDWFDLYRQGIVANDHRNDIIAKYAQWFRQQDKRVLILVRELEHGHRLQEAIPKSVFVHGGTADNVLDATTRRFEAGKVSTLIATSIFDEGVDLPSVNALILAAGGKSQISTLQRIGRGMRHKDGDNRLTVIDFMDHTSYKLHEHSELRRQICKNEKYEIVMLDKTAALSPCLTAAPKPE